MLIQVIYMIYVNLCSELVFWTYSMVLTVYVDLVC
jgi:hypothetical protein